MKENEKIKKVQEYIKSLGLENLPELNKIMSKDVYKFEKELDYYKNLGGKYLKYNSENFCDYIFIYPKIDKYTFGGNPTIDVTVDRYHIRNTKDYYSFSEELGHHLSSTSIKRYENYNEISEEKFKSDIEKFKKLQENFKNICDNL